MKAGLARLQCATASDGSSRNELGTSNRVDADTGSTFDLKVEQLALLAAPRASTWSAHILAPLRCQEARAAAGLPFVWGPGCGLIEESTVGVGSAALILVVAPICPPGPRWAAWASAASLW